MRLRAALRAHAAADGPAAERAARLELEAVGDPLLDRLFPRLLRHCHGMVTSEGAFRPRNALFDADDLAIEAWERTLRYLKEPSGDRVETDQHLWNLLRCAASNRLVDRLRRHSDELAHQAPQDADVSEEERLESAGAAAQPGPERDALLWGADHRGWRLVELLFRHEERFHVRFRLVTDRHPRQFRALVLYELGALLHREVNTPAATPAGRRQECSLMRRYAALLGIPPADWARVEQAAVAEEEDPGDGALIPGLRDAVNALCDTSVRTRTGLTTLRYELKRILKSPPARALEWK